MRIQSANKSYFGAKSLLKSIFTNLKIQMYFNTSYMTLSLSSYQGSETRALRKTEEARLDIFERKTLRQIYGSHIDPQTREWRIRDRCNEELQNVFRRSCVSGETNLVGYNRRKKDSMIQIITEKDPTGKRTPRRTHLGPKSRLERSSRRQN